MKLILNNDEEHIIDIESWTKSYLSDDNNIDYKILITQQQGSNFTSFSYFKNFRDIIITGIQVKSSLTDKILYEENDIELKLTEFNETLINDVYYGNVTLVAFVRPKVIEYDDDT